MFTNIEIANLSIVAIILAGFPVGFFFYRFRAHKPARVAVAVAAVFTWFALVAIIFQALVPAEIMWQFEQTPEHNEAFLRVVIGTIAAVVTCIGGQMLAGNKFD